MHSGYGGLPSRRKVRGPLHPPNRAPPSIVDGDHATASHHDRDEASTGKKRGWTSTVRRSSNLPSLPWQPMTSSTGTPALPSPSPSSSYPAGCAGIQPPQGDFVFNPGLSMRFNAPGSAVHLPRDESSGTLTRSHSHTGYSSTSTSSPASFHTAIDLDPQIAAHGTISSHGMPSAQQALLQEQRKTVAGAQGNAPDEHDDGPPSKRRRGLAGTIVDTALNAALYTGAAALTAYSLWSSWGRKPEDHEPEPDGGHAIPAQKTTSEEKQAPLGAPDEPPPPYYNGHDSVAGPSTPRSPSYLRRQRVFVSSPKNRRRPAFQPRRAMPLGNASGQAITEAFAPRAGPMESSSGPFLAQGEGSGDTNACGEGGHENGDDDDDDDGMFQRFQDKMNTLIAQGQAALVSKPTLDAMDFDQDEGDVANPSTLSSSVSAPTLIASQQGQVGDHNGSNYSSSPFTSRPTDALRQDWNAASLRYGMPQSQSQPAALHLHSDSVSYLPEPVKRSHQTPTGAASSMGAARFDFQAPPDRGSGGGGAWPSLGGTPSSQGPSSPFASGTMEASTAGRISTLRDGPASSPASGSGSPSRRLSRLPRPTSSSLHARRPASGYAPR